MVQTCAVSGELNVPDEADSTSARTPPQLVGRDEEIGLLRRAWQQAQGGHGQVVLVSGEPGIGKSALAATLLAQLREHGAPRATVRCSAFHTSSTMFPIIEHVRRLVGWVSGDPPDANLARLEARLAQGPQRPHWREEAAPLLACSLLQRRDPVGCNEQPTHKQATRSARPGHDRSSPSTGIERPS